MLTMNDAISKNIRKYREMKGYSQEYMAHELQINQASYAKIENSSTMLTVERLFTISKLLETDVSEILDLKKSTIFNQTENETANAFGKIEHYYQDNKEITAKLLDQYETRLKEKDEQMALLKKLLQDKK